MAEAVLITGARAPVALDLARGFAAAGYAVHMADSAPARIARWSRVPRHVHPLPPPRQAAAAFAASVVALVDALDPVLIVPTCEEIFHLVRLGLDRLFAPDREMLVRLHAKDRFAAFAARLGLAAPETYRLDSPATLAPFRADPRRWVFKPIYSRFGTKALVGPVRLTGIMPTEDDPWVAQRRVMGEEASFYAVCRDGRLTAFAAYRSTWRLGGGAGYAFAALPDDQSAALGTIAAALAANIGQGQFACDAIRDGDGRFQLIECNPRATSGVHLFGRGPALARAIADGTPAVPVAGLAPHVAPALWSYGLRTAAGRWRWRDWFAAQRQGCDVVGAPGDRWPVAGALADSAGFGLKALAHRRSLAAQMTADIEWNGEG